MTVSVLATSRAPLADLSSASASLHSIGMKHCGRLGLLRHVRLPGLCQQPVRILSASIASEIWRFDVATRLPAVGRGWRFALAPPLWAEAASVLGPQPIWRTSGLRRR